jgi:Skp family chaperone for outer membrane proteins
MNRRFLFAAALLAATFIAEAQQFPPGKWWRRDEVVRHLELTREQQDKLDEVFRGTADDLIDAKASVDKLQVALRGELDRTQLRRQELQRLAAQLSQARGKLFEREVMMLADMRGILDQEQWTRLRTHLDRRPERGGRGDGQQQPPQRQPQRRRP